MTHSIPLLIKSFGSNVESNFHCESPYFRHVYVEFLRLTVKHSTYSVSFPLLSLFSCGASFLGMGDSSLTVNLYRPPNTKTICGMKETIISKSYNLDFKSDIAKTDTGSTPKNIFQADPTWTTLVAIPNYDSFFDWSFWPMVGLTISLSSMLPLQCKITHSFAEASRLFAVRCGCFCFLLF